jgi:hypothetical protein
MKRGKFYIISLIIALFSCQQHSSKLKPDEGNAVTSLNVSGPDTFRSGINKKILRCKNLGDSCHELFLSLLKSSNFDPLLRRMEFDVRIEEVANGVVTLELITKNEERGEDVALSWFEIDFNNRELRDITVDPDKPMELKYDSNLFTKVAQHCQLNK